MMASNFEDEDGDEKGSINSLLSDEGTGDDHLPETKYKRSRNLVGFWLLGLCNNFSYVVMLSAAHDILHPRNTTASAHQNFNTSSLFLNGSANGSSSVDGLECNPLSTGTVLLADILPTVFIKVTAPFYMKRISYNIRILVCIMFAFASFFIIAYSHVFWFSLLGVVCASLSSGLGEITILSFSAHFDKNVVSAWSSGTGAAGLFGALSYAGLISAGMSPRNTVLVMNIVPFLFGLSFWFILEYPSYMMYNGSCQTLYSPIYTTSNTQGDEDTTKYMSIYEKLVITKSLLKYMIPLFLVYFAEYFINQGLQELIYWNGIWLTPAEQYRWYQVDYQLGVLISRSSVNLFPIKNTYLLAFLQYVNLVVLFFEAYFHYLPSVWIMFTIILFEGLFGGAVYVNSFYRISKEVAPEHKEFSMGVASMADSLGIALAGATALPTHNALCSYWHKKER